jgi:hypothetical protein
MCIDCLKNDVENNCWNYDKCKYFLTYGNLECFKYAHQNGCPPNILFYNEDKLGEDYSPLCWLIDDDCPCFGLKHDNGCPYEKQKILFKKDMGGFYDYSHYLYECRYDITCNIIECIKYAYENGICLTTKINPMDGTFFYRTEETKYSYDKIMKICIKTEDKKYVYKNSYFIKDYDYFSLDEKLLAKGYDYNFFMPKSETFNIDIWENEKDEAVYMMYRNCETIEDFIEKNKNKYDNVMNELNIKNNINNTIKI